MSTGRRHVKKVEHEHTQRVCDCLRASGIQKSLVRTLLLPFAVTKQPLRLARASAEPYRLTCPSSIMRESSHYYFTFCTLLRDHDMGDGLTWHHQEGLPPTRRKMAPSRCPRTVSRCHGHQLPPKDQNQP